MTQYFEGVDHRRLVSYLGKIVGFEAAEDVAQTAYLRAWAGRESFKGDIAKPTTWFWSIARNVACDHLRYCRRHPDAAFAIPLDVFLVNDDIEAKPSSRIARIELEAELRRLKPDDLRALLVYTRIGSYTDAARELGWKVPKFKSRLHGVRLQLGARLSGTPIAAVLMQQCSQSRGQSRGQSRAQSRGQSRAQSRAQLAA